MTKTNVGKERPNSSLEQFKLEKKYWDLETCKNC